MKLYIIGENPIVPHLIALLAKDYEIKVDCNVYTKDLDVEKLTVSDLTLKTNFVDVIFLVNTKQIHQKIILKDGSKTLNDAIFNLYQESLWFSLNMNSLMNYYVDKYDLKHYDLSEISPFYICSRLAFNEIVLQKMITQSQKLLHQQKVLILGYSTTTKLLCELLSSNRMIVVVSDRLLQELIEAKKEGEDIGEKRGKLIGEEYGEIKKLMKLLLKKFPNKNFEWVKECSKTQLEKIDDYIFLNISYNDFYKLIHS